MQNYAKLLPVLLLGSALSGCSMAGFGDGFGGDFGQQAQQGQYWGSTPSCDNQLNTNVVNTNSCQGSYPVAQSNVVTQPYGGQVYGGQVVAPSSYAASQTVAPAYGAQSYVAQGQNFPALQGQQGFQGGFAPAFVGPQSGASNGLRQAYTYGTLGGILYDVDSDLFGIQGRLGWQSKSLFGAEVEGSLGVSNDNGFVDFGAGFVEAEQGIDTQIAAFAVLRSPISNRLNVLTRVGYHNTEFDAELDDGVTVIEQDFSTDGLAYGIGVEYALNPNTSVRADYTRYDFDGPEADSLSLAIARKF